MATASVTLSAASPAAERALFALPTWVEMDTETAGAATATHAALAQFQHCLTHITVSLSAAAATALTLLIKDGTTVIWQVELGVGVTVFTENFETRPLHATVNTALVATIASGGAAIVGTISMCGFSVRQA